MNGFGEGEFVRSLVVEMEELRITKEDIDNADLVSKESNQIS